MEKPNSENWLFDSIINLCENLSFVGEPDKLTAAFVNNLAEIFNAGKVSFMLLDEVKEELSIKAFQGLDPSLVDEKVKLGQSFSGRVAAEGKPLLVKNIEDEFPAVSGRRLRYSSKSFIIVPVKSAGKNIGVICVTDRKDGGLFDECDLKALYLAGLYFALCIENNKLFEKNKQLLVLDPLTDLFNHSFFLSGLLEEIYRAERYRRPLSVLVLDIDRFSDYNRVHGYAAGDNVLKKLGRIIKENIRQIDIPSRSGFDEFAIILPETKLKEASFVGDKIRERISAAVFMEVEGRKAALGMSRLAVSIGIAEHAMGLSVEELTRRAQSALKEAQQKGGNCICVFK